MTDQEIQQDFPFEQLEEEMISPIKGVELSDMEEFVALMLSRASSENPVRMAEIITAALHEKTETLSDRMVRRIVRSLRRDHGFPICTRKGTPAGYYWGRSESELEEFSKAWMSQYLDEAETLHMMLKANYPRLAGQMRLSLERED